MYVFGTVEASAALRPCCGCSVLPGGRALPRRGGAGGNEAVRVVLRRAGWVLPRRGKWVRSGPGGFY